MHCAENFSDINPAHSFLPSPGRACSCHCPALKGTVCVQVAITVTSALVCLCHIMWLGAAEGMCRCHFNFKISSRVRPGNRAAEI